MAENVVAAMLLMVKGMSTEEPDKQLGSRQIKIAPSYTL